MTRESRARPSTSDVTISTWPCIPPWTAPVAQPPTPLLDPRDAKKPWPLNPWTNPYLWPKSKAPGQESVERLKPNIEWGHIEEEVDFPNRWSENIPSTDPGLPKTLGCVTYTDASSPNSPAAVGILSNNLTVPFPTTYKALATLFYNHCKLQRHAKEAIDATERQTLLASSPFVKLYRYKSDIEKEIESLNLCAKAIYENALEEWKTGDGNMITEQEMAEMEEAMMTFKKEQDNRHLCIVSTQLLGQGALVIDAFQLWDALLMRDLLTKEQIAEEEVKGIFLVWKRVPKEAVVSCEPMVEKEKPKKRRISESKREVPTAREVATEYVPQISGSLGIRSAYFKGGGEYVSPYRTPVEIQPRQKTGSLGEPKSLNAKGQLTPKKVSKVTRSTKADRRVFDQEASGETAKIEKQPAKPLYREAEQFVPDTVKRKRTSTVTEKLENSGLSDAPLSRGNSRRKSYSTPRVSRRGVPARYIPPRSQDETPSKSTRRLTTRGSALKITKAQVQDDIFAVDSVLDHRWGLWKKKAGTYTRDKKGTPILEYLVKWAGSGYENTWEPEPNIGEKCLDVYWDTYGPKPDAPPSGYVFSV